MKNIFEIITKVLIGGRKGKGSAKKGKNTSGPMSARCLSGGSFQIGEQPVVVFAQPSAFIFHLNFICQFIFNPIAVITTTSSLKIREMSSQEVIVKSEDSTEWEFNCPQYVDFTTDPPITPARPEARKDGSSASCDHWFTPSAKTPCIKKALTLKKENLTSKKDVTTARKEMLTARKENMAFRHCQSAKKPEVDLVRDMKNLQFRATPVNKKILATNSLVVGVPKVRKAQVTQVREFKFQTDERIKIRTLRRSLVGALPNQGNALGKVAQPKIVPAQKRMNSLLNVGGRRKVAF